MGACCSLSGYRIHPAHPGFPIQSPSLIHPDSYVGQCYESLHLILEGRTFVYQLMHRYDPIHVPSAPSFLYNQFCAEITFAHTRLDLPAWVSTGSLHVWLKLFHFLLIDVICHFGEPEYVQNHLSSNPCSLSYPIFCEYMSATLMAVSSCMDVEFKKYKKAWDKWAHYMRLMAHEYLPLESVPLGPKPSTENAAGPLWSYSKFGTDIPDIDADHERLFKLIYIYQVIVDSTFPSPSNDWCELQRILAALYEYSIVHFAREEYLMASKGYPKDLADSHKDRHREYTGRIHKTLCRVENNQFDMKEIGELKTWLHTWLSVHIGVEDKRYVAYVS